MKLRGRTIRPHKASIHPTFASRTVLTNEPWQFVTLALKRQRQRAALFFWEQARTFHIAAEGLPLESAPLLLYYSFMNAAKALLSARGVAFDNRHGVTEWKTGITGRDSLKTVGVEIKNAGILPALSGYYQETESHRKHTLQELFFNMPFIHRTYCLTYKTQTEMFVPLVNCRFLCDRDTDRAYFGAKLSRDYSSLRIVKRLPPSLIADGKPPAPEPSEPPSGPPIRSATDAACTRPFRPSQATTDAITSLHQQLRTDLFYINGTQTLWYAKTKVAGPRRLARQCPTLALAAMHRLSELSRYQPMALAAYLSGPQNWLLSEFITMSPAQFIDEVASEITGHEFLVPNVRAAT